MFEAALEFLKNLMQAAEEKEAALNRLAPKQERPKLFNTFSVKTLTSSANGAVRRFSVRNIVDAPHTRSQKDLIN